MAKAIQLEPGQVRESTAPDLSDWDGNATAPDFQKFLDEVAAILERPRMAAQEEERRQAEVEAKRTAEEERQRVDTEARRNADEDAERVELERKQRKSKAMILLTAAGAMWQDFGNCPRSVPELTDQATQQTSMFNNLLKNM